MNEFCCLCGDPLDVIEMMIDDLDDIWMDKMCDACMEHGENPRYDD